VPAIGAPTMLLLRAALQSRGVWEVDLLAPCDKKTYLRAHRLDSRRRPTTSLANPMDPSKSFDPLLNPSRRTLYAAERSSMSLPCQLLLPPRWARDRPLASRTSGAAARKG